MKQADLTVRGELPGLPRPGRRPRQLSTRASVPGAAFSLPSFPSGLFTNMVATTTGDQRVFQLPVIARTYLPRAW
jgi:hypothetical protein